MSAKLKFPVETTYINTFIEQGYGLSWTVRANQQLQECSVGLVDVTQVLRTGVVYDSDYLDREGGLWSVYGKTTENIGLRVSVVVVSSEYRVRIEGIEKATGRKK